MNRRDLLAGAGLTLAAARTILAAEEGGSGLSIRAEEGDVRVAYGDRPVLRYRARAVQPPAGVSPLLAASGFIHPVHAPNGTVVTDYLSPDHPHQRGVFLAWTKTRVRVDGSAVEPDFWNIHQGTGRVRFDGFPMVREAAPLRRFGAKHVSEARIGDEWVPLLDESWQIELPLEPPADPDAPGALWYFDLTSRQKPRVDIELPKYHYGGMAVRGARQWGKGSDLQVLTSEGKDRAGADAAKARWIDMSGTVAGKAAGIALLEHPANPHAPNGVRMHPDMPYYAFALPQSGPMTLEAGKEYVFRYRVAAHNGRADAKRLGELWESFSRG